MGCHTWDRRALIGWFLPCSTSERRGWELMWLATGCFTPSTNLTREVLQFLRSRRNQISTDCVNRMQKTQKFVAHCLPWITQLFLSLKMLCLFFFKDIRLELFVVLNSHSALFLSKIIRLINLFNTYTFIYFILVYVILKETAPLKEDNREMLWQLC